jgi:tryptophan synthase alpha subunit
VRDVCQWADAAVVGSSLVSVIAEAGADPRVAERVGEHVRWLLGK